MDDTCKIAEQIGSDKPHKEVVNAYDAVAGMHKEQAPAVSGVGEAPKTHTPFTLGE